MILKEEFLSSLRKIFGLNLYEVRIWTALLSRGVSTAGELSDIGGVPRSRTYDILESLEKKGFVVMKLGKPIKFIALKPIEVVERVKKRVSRNAVEMCKRLDEIKGSNVIEELNTLYIQGIKYVDPVDLGGTIRGRNNIHNHLDMMIRNAEKNFTIVTTADGLNRKFESLKPVLEKAKKRGVQIKIAVPITPKNLKVAKELGKVAEIKHTKVNARFALADNKEALLMVLDDAKVHPNYDVGIWITSPFFASALGNLVDSYWTQMTPISKVKV